MSYLGCSARLYLSLFIGGLISYLGCSVRLYLSLFIGGLISYLGCSVRLLPLVVYWRPHVLFRMFGSSFTSRYLLEGSCLI